MANVQTEALSTTAENVTFDLNGSTIYLENLSVTAAEVIWVRWDGTTVVAAADGAYPIPAGTGRTFRIASKLRTSNSVVVSALSASGTPSLFGYVVAN